MTDALTVGVSTFTYLVIGAFAQQTPDYLSMQRGVLDGEEFDQVELDGASDEE